MTYFKLLHKNTNNLAGSKGRSETGEGRQEKADSFAFIVPLSPFSRFRFPVSRPPVSSLFSLPIKEKTIILLKITVWKKVIIIA